MIQPPEVVKQAFQRCISLQGASDVHFSPGQPPWIRFGGTFNPHKDLPTTDAAATEQIALWGGGRDQPYEVSTSVNIGQDRWRITTYYAVGGWTIACRLIPLHVIPSETLDA